MFQQESKQNINLEWKKELIGLTVSEGWPL